MNDPLAFLRKLIGDPDSGQGAAPASADIPTLTRVAEDDAEISAPAHDPVSSGAPQCDMVDQLVAEYLPVIEHELRRRLRERLATHAD